MENEKPKCSSIDHVKTEAIIFCNICNVYLCNKCDTFHSKIFPNHPIQKISKENNNFFSNICSEKNHFNKLKYFCKTHNKLCCVACITKIKDEENGQHKDCEIFVLKDIKSEKESQFNEDFTKLEQMSKSIEQTINQLKLLNEEINKQKEELIMNIQKVFTELRTALNQREDQLLLKIEELFTKNFFGEEMIRESEKLPGTIKKCLDSGDMIRDKWNKENELSEAINYYVVFRNNINQIDEINQKINKCNSNKVRIFFENNKKGLEETVKKFGNLIEKEEGKEKEKEKKSSSSDSDKSDKSKNNSRRSSFSSVGSKHSDKSKSYDDYRDY